MAQLVLGVAGAVVGAYIGGPQGAQIGFALGSAAGGYYETVNKKFEGPKLNDLKFTGTEYGECIPYVLGSPRISGQIWWASDKRAVANTTGGKGGEPEVTNYTYEIDLLIGLSSNEISGIGRIWWNGKLVYNGTERTDLWRRMTIYKGEATQDPDPTYEAAVGVGNAPAYRGRGSVFFEGLQLDSGGNVPNLTFEMNGSTETAWNPADKDADVVLSVNSTIATVTNAYGSVRGVQGRSSAATTYYFEVECSGTDGGRVLIGIATTSANLGTYPGADDQAWTYYGYNGTIYNNGSGGGSADTYAAGDIIGVAMVGGISPTVAFYKNGVLQSIGASIAGGTWYPVWGPGIDTDGARSGRLITSGVTYLPSGATEWGGLAPPPDVTLQEAVEDLCARSGLETTDIDASGLSTITQPVRSLAIAQVEPMRGSLDQLRQAFLFDTYLTDKIYFVPRGGSVARTLTYAEIGAGFDAAEEDPLQVTIANDLELPPQVAVQYRNVSNDYQAGTEYSDRLISGQVAAAVVQFGIGLTPAEAKKAADTIIVDGHAGIVSAPFSVTTAHTELVPTDVVQVTDSAGKLLRLRITSRRDDGGVIVFNGVRDDAGAVESEALTDDGYTEQDTVTVYSETVLEPMDIPLLQDADDAPGYYVAARGESSKWAGAVVQASVNDVDFTEVARVAESAVLGVCTTTLASGSTAIVDEVNTVTVSVAHGELSSSTRDAMLADETVNVMLIGSEVVRFITATASSTDPNVYVLKRLFRGQLGTEWAVGSHGSNERCVLLRPRGLRRVTTTASEIGAARYVRGVSLGLATSTATSEAFTNEGVSQTPWAPVNLRQSLSGSDYTITWDRRSRLRSRFASSAGISVPLGEESEAYEVDLFNGPTLVDTFTATSPTVTFSGSYSGYTVVVYQLSETVGRGYASASLTLI